MTVDYSLAALLEQSTRVNELAQSLGLDVKVVRRVLAAVGEMPAREMVQLCGTEAQAEKDKRLMAINRETRRNEPRE